MGRYRKKPIEVEALQYFAPGPGGSPTGNVDALQQFGAIIEPSEAWDPTSGNTDLLLYVVKSDAMCVVRPRDWVIKESDGSGFYPCKSGLFEATYEKASA